MNEWRGQWHDIEEEEVAESSEFFLSISDLMSGLLLLVCALLIIALINVSEKQTVLAKQQQTLQKTRKRLEQLKVQLSTLLQKRQLIITRVQELERKLRRAGLNVKVRPETGDVIIKDQGIFFRSGRHLLQRRGKKFLQTFSRAYFKIILSKDFRNSIKRVVVVGHASADGKEQENLRISLLRAESVTNYIQSLPFVQGSRRDQRLHKLLKQKLLVAGRGAFDSHKTRMSKDRTVRFHLLFRGDALEIQKLFAKYGFQTKSTTPTSP